MPQLIWGQGNPLAVSIEAAALMYLAQNPPSLLTRLPGTPLIQLSALYLAYNMFVVPRFS